MCVRVFTLVYLGRQVPEPLTQLPSSLKIILTTSDSHVQSSEQRFSSYIMLFHIHIPSLGSSAILMSD